MRDFNFISDAYAFKNHKSRLIINFSEHSSIFDRKLLPQISIFFPNSKSLLKYTLKLTNCRILLLLSIFFR
jgi:hypothetical protein